MASHQSDQDLKHKNILIIFMLWCNKNIKKNYNNLTLSLKKSILNFTFVSWSKLLKWILIITCKKAVWLKIDNYSRSFVIITKLNIVIWINMVILINIVTVISIKFWRKNFHWSGRKAKIFSIVSLDILWWKFTKELTHN